MQKINTALLLVMSTSTFCAVLIIENITFSVRTCHSITSMNPLHQCFPCLFCCPPWLQYNESGPPNQIKQTLSMYRSTLAGITRHQYTIQNITIVNIFVVYGGGLQSPGWTFALCRGFVPRTLATSCSCSCAILVKSVFQQYKIPAV